jgi:hypothetical protein
MLLGGPEARESEARLTLDVGGLRVPIIPLFFREQLVFAPRLRGGAERSAGPRLRRRARVFRNDIAVPVQPAVVPRIDKAAHSATHGLAPRQEFRMQL